MDCMRDKSNPFRNLEELFERMSREFDGFDAGLESRVGGGGVNADVAEGTEDVTVTVDIPGFDKSDIDVAVKDDVLTIAAEHSESTEQTGPGDEDVTYHRRERRRSVSRRIRLPSEVEESEASATYNNGVLTVTLPKLTVDDTTGHSIDVN